MEKELDLWYLNGNCTQECDCCERSPQKPAVHIGLRNLKTALSASLCALIYYFLDRNPAFACIGAIFGMGANMEHSKLHGGNRLFGTIIGGFLGIFLYRIYLIFYPEGDNHLLLVPLLFVGVVILIVLAQIFWVGAVQPGGVVLCLLLFNIGSDNYISYSLNRMLDTGVGVVMSLLINWLLPRERLDAWQAALKARLPHRKG
ncbi:aromatic acid exporter family protein [Flavonifractor sp. An306]|uniref:FUSC family protein n=1 Tax=Flavonifractor sp. An306 TaxID=1965629 RepID=UPI001FA8BAC4|nr:aromatic acid exporter family protein [Flavonifractor sp. An306]